MISFRKMSEIFDIRLFLKLTSNRSSILLLLIVHLLIMSTSYLTMFSHHRRVPRKIRPLREFPSRTHVAAASSLHCPQFVNISIEGARTRVRLAQASLEEVGSEIFHRGYERAKVASILANDHLPSIRERRLKLRSNATTIDETMAKMSLSSDVDDYRVLPGGHWTPTSCKPRWKVAIVVPFRDRFKNLPIFLRHIVPLLKKQKLEFSIFVVEQRNETIFNKAMLMNIAFLEALNFTDYDCAVFHDVDHIALNVKNYLGCDDFPRHLVSGEAAWNYKLMYQALFGGVIGLTTAQMRDINGLPNQYWGWGGEDDDIGRRVKAAGYNRTRPMGEIGYFATMRHKPSNVNKRRFCLLKNFKERMREDGLSNLAYPRPTIELYPLYTNITVAIHRLSWNPEWTNCTNTPAPKDKANKTKEIQTKGELLDKT